MGLKYDNARDQAAYGYDAGVIVDGMVTLDEDTRELVLVDEDGVAFSPQAFLRAHLGKIVRFTGISLDSMKDMESMLGGGQNASS